ncbi:MAG: hypothetical protein LIO44_02650 [Eubacterium sp.]|nr:hypothetical protein [Eubacterium sp.]
MLYEYQINSDVILSGWGRWLLCFIVAAVFAAGLIWAFSKRKEASENPGLYPFHYRLVNEKNPYFMLKIFAGFACYVLVLCFLTFFTVKTYLVKPLYCAHCVKTGQFETVSGRVEDFDPGVKGGEESFEINGIKFGYSENEPCGYSIFSKDSGVITGNGQELKISYIYAFSENIIVYIEDL